MNIKKALLTLLLSVLILCGLFCAIGIIGIAGTTGEKNSMAVLAIFSFLFLCHALLLIKRIYAHRKRQDPCGTTGVEQKRRAEDNDALAQFVNGTMNAEDSRIVNDFISYLTSGTVPDNLLSVIRNAQEGAPGTRDPFRTASQNRPEELRRLFEVAKSIVSAESH